ncbi:MAG: hypothetical protein ACYCTI_12540 [Acidimicrobiales bacterium]
MSRRQSTGSGLESKSGGALRAHSGGSVARVAVGTVVGVVAVVLAWNLIVGLVHFAITIAVLVVIVGAIVFLVRRIF